MIRRFLTRVLILILLAACAYNWMQTQRLQAQVAALEATAAQPRHIAAVPHVPDLHFRLSSLHGRYSLHDLNFLQGQWKRLQHQAGAFRSTRKKVLSYVQF